MSEMKGIGKNDDIDSSGLEIESYVGFVPEEMEVDASEERSEAQRITDGDSDVMVFTEEDEILVTPNSEFNPEKKTEDTGEEEESSEEEEVKEEKEEESDEEEESADDEEEEKEEKQEEEPAKEEVKKEKASAPDAVQKRINKITREKYEALREKEKLEKELAELRKTHEETEFAAKKADLKASKPSPEDFDSDEEYHESLGRWAAKTEILEDKTAKQEEESTSEEEPVDAVQNIINLGKEKYPDFEELVLREDLKITPGMIEAAADSDYADDIFYHLGQHPELATKISKMRSPTKIAREIGRIEFKFIGEEVEEVYEQKAGMDSEFLEKSKPKKKKIKTSPAPPPVKPLGGGGKTAKRPEEMSIAEYNDWRGYTRDGMKKRNV